MLDQTITPSSQLALPFYKKRSHWAIFIFGLLGGLILGYVIVPSRVVLAPEDKIAGGVNTNPTNQSAMAADWVTINPQLPGDVVMIKKITMTEPAWVTIYDYEKSSGQLGNILGAGMVPAGSTNNIRIDLLRGMVDGEHYYLGLRRDNGDRTFDYQADLPITSPAGKILGTTFTVEAQSPWGN